MEKHTHNENKIPVTNLPKWEAPQLFIEGVENSETGNIGGGPEGVHTISSTHIYGS